MKNMNMVKVIFFILFLMCVMVLNSQPRAQEFDKVPNDGWPSQVVFDTIHVCYNGIVRWIAMGNPQLLTQQPPPHIARIMTVHCFCVLDQIRIKYKYEAYVDFINNISMEDQSLLPKLFMKKSLECVKKYSTLAGLVMLDEEALKGLEEWSDDETKIEEKVDPPDNNSGKSDSPERPEELPTEESPILNF